MIYRVAVRAEEIQIADRLRRIRQEKRLSQRLAATQMGLSRGQLRRVERGEVAVRFFPAWNFCQFTNTNPLWLAYGDPEARHGFLVCANSNVPDDATFLAVMDAYGEQYRTFRFFTHASMRAAGDVFSDNNPVLRADFVMLNRRDEKGRKKNIATQLIKRYLISEMAEALLNWDDLRAALRSETESSKAKAQLARRLGVTLAAISQWRSGASAPTADKALRALGWVLARRAGKQKKSAGSAETRPARKAQKRKARSNAKPKSSQPKR